MHVLAPDLLEELRQLPPYATAGLGVAGLFLWSFGGRFHRFWLALALTLTAGTFGLVYGQAYNTQPIVAGTLLAVSAGALALSLVRLLLFVTGGVLGLALMRALAPEWNEPLVSFVSGGLAGILLYRLWVVALSSLVGTVALGYSVLGLVDRLGRLDSADWAQHNGPLLNWAVGGAAMCGMLVQFLLERRRRRRERQAAENKKKPAPKPRPAPPPEPPKEPWWKAQLPDVFKRKAG